MAPQWPSNAFCWTEGVVGPLKTELLSVIEETDEDRWASIARVAHILKSGRLVAFPTDTVYGVAAVPDRPGAVASLYVAKERPPDKAIPVLLADVHDLYAVVTEASDLVRCLIDRFWPGGLTLVLPKSSIVPSELSPKATIAVRMPALSLTREIISAVGSPLAVTSANRSGQPSPRTAAAVMAQLGGRIAAVLDGGTCPGGVPSTILDCTTEPPRLLRAGAVPLEALRQFTAVA
jgi:L-threonylcarbamoyladenylate synthase